jgi:hypothetical protein
MDLEQIKLDGKYNPEEILSLLDDFMTGTIGFIRLQFCFYTIQFRSKHINALMPG